MRRHRQRPPPRLREAAKLAGPQGWRRSGTGGRDAGESHAELDKRKIRHRIVELQQEIAAMEVERKTQPLRRRGRRIARATRDDTTAWRWSATRMRENRLRCERSPAARCRSPTSCSPHSTTVRALHPESVPGVLVTDTVGFIKKLPHGLVFNKIDHVGDALTPAEREAALLAKYPDCIVMSAWRKADVATLHQAIVGCFRRDQVEAELFLPWSAQRMRGEIFATCEVLSERANEAGACFSVRGDAEALQGLHEKLGRA